MERDAVLNLRVAAKVKDALKRAAAADHGRSLSGMADRVFREWLSTHGFLRPEGTDDVHPERGASHSG